MAGTQHEELWWASGLFEGEGSFESGVFGGSKRRTLYSRANLKSTDEDAVRRFAAALGFGWVGGPYAGAAQRRVDGSLRKPYWQYTAAGFEKTQALVAMLWSGLNARRRARAREVLAAHGRKVR